MATSKKKSLRYSKSAHAVLRVEKSPDLRDLLGEAPEVFQLFGVAHAVEYLRQYVKHGQKYAPSLADRIAMLGRVAQKTDPKSALELAEKAIEISAQCIEAILLAAHIQDRLGRKTESAALALRAVESELAMPDQVLAGANMLVRFGYEDIALIAAKQAFQSLSQPLRHIPAFLYIVQRTADWEIQNNLTDRLRDAYLSGQSQEVIEEPRDHLLWCGDLGTNILVAKKWSEHRLPLPSDTLTYRHNPISGRRLRLGYLSSDFREHPTSRLIHGLLRHHDHDRFELFMYCSGWDDGSALRKDIESHFDHIHSVSEFDDQTAAKLINSHNIDVLVELNGPTRANRMGILGFRPAPVQIGYLGFPGSVGGRIVDYIVADDYTVTDGQEKLYPEKLIRIPHTYQVNDYMALKPLPKLTRKQIDLPEGDILILGMFNAIDKIHAEVWRAWMRILKAVPNAMLWTLNVGQTTLQHVAAAAIAEGIDPNRIIIAPSMPQEEHLARIQGCDLMLDPWPYGGHTTTSDALFAGVPVITLEGTNFAGRVSGGLLRAAGLELLVQPNQETYIAKAIELLRNPFELSRIKQHLRSTAMYSPVFDAVGRTNDLEAAYLLAFDKAEKGIAPEHIFIGESATARSIPVYKSLPISNLNRLNHSVSCIGEKLQEEKINDIEAFIISWEGQHEKAQFISMELQSILNKVSIIYSDPDPNFSLDVQCTQIKRPNELFWGDKFKACIDTFSEKLLLIIHADCICEDWPGLAKKCLDTFNYHSQVAVWSPKIEGTPYDVRVTTVAQIEQTTLSIVTNTDGIVFCLNKQIVERMKKADFSENIYGWGIDIMFSAHALTIDKLVVVDNSISIRHSTSTGYSKILANDQCNLFLKQLSTTERVQYFLSDAYVNLRRNAFREVAKFS